MIGQTVEAFVPKRSIYFEPVGCLFKRLGGQPAGRHCAVRPREMRPARSNTFRCFETPGRLIVSGWANSLTEASPSVSRAKIARRVGSARAPKVALSASATVLFQLVK